VADEKGITLAEERSFESICGGQISERLTIPFKNMNKGTAGKAMNPSMNCLVYKAK
jgi:hypothetical protein